jgi:hypothetical protein
MSTTVARSLDDLRRDVAGKRRTLSATVKWDPENRSDSMSVSGHAAVFDTVSEDLGFRETLAPGCFRNVLARPGEDPFLLFAHDPNLVLARRSAGTLDIAEDAHGLAFAARVVPTSTGKDVVTLVRSGHVTGCSFAFTVKRDEWSMRDGVPHRRVLEVASLPEVTITPSPAYLATSVRDRSRTETKADLQRRIERTVARHRANRPTGTASPYTPDGPFSFFRDLLVVTEESRRRQAASQAGVTREYGSLGDPGFLRDNLNGGIPEARARLQALARDLTTTNTDGGGFVPGNVTNLPVHLAEAFALSVHDRGVLPRIFPVAVLPDRGVEIGAARLTTGIGVETKATENVAVSEADAVEEKVTSPVSMVMGLQDVSLQLLERGDPPADVWIAQELGRAIGEETDRLILTGSGAKPFLRGLDNVSGIATVTWNDGSPTAAEFITALAELASRVAEAMGTPPSHVLAHPRRVAWLHGNLASTHSLPDTLMPFGMSLVPVPAITTLEGASTNQDACYVVCAPELQLELGPAIFEVHRQEVTLSSTGTVRCIARRYVGAVLGRRPEATGRLSGTGLVNWYS